MRTDWANLPAELRIDIEAKTGPISTIDPASTGNHAAVASTLHTANGRVFVKAARKLEDRDGPEVMSLRREAAVNPSVIEYAPRLLWQAETGGWLALGFEHVQARHADYSPGSPDLAVLAKTVHALQATSCPEAVKMRVERRWASVADDVTAMAGDALLHTDLNSDNLLITADGRAFVVDWAFVSRGAAWIELGQLIPWLLKAGHSPKQADEWICQFPSWTEADPVAIDLYTRCLVQRWSSQSSANAASWIQEYAALVQLWATYRMR